MIRYGFARHKAVMEKINETKKEKLKEILNQVNIFLINGQKFTKILSKKVSKLMVSEGFDLL
jgi:hypothetical protein